MTAKAAGIMALAILVGTVAGYAVEAWQGLQDKFLWVGYGAMLAFFFAHQLCRSWPLAIGAAWLTVHEWLGKTLSTQEQCYLIPSLLAFAIAAEMVESHWTKKLGAGKRPSTKEA